MRQFFLLVFSLFLLTACNSDGARKKGNSQGFPPPGGTEASTDDNKPKADNDEAGKPRTYDDNEVGTGRFRIEAPEGWTKSDTFLMGSTFTFLRSPEEENDDFLENVNVVKENVGNASLEEYFDKSLSMMKSRITGFEEGASGNKVINGIEFKNLKYSHNYNGMPLAVDMYLAIHKQVGFVITCSATKQSLPQFQPTFDQVMQSFSFQ